MSGLHCPNCKHILVAQKKEENHWSIGDIQYAVFVASDDNIWVGRVQCVKLSPKRKEPTWKTMDCLENITWSGHYRSTKVEALKRWQESQVISSWHGSAKSEDIVKRILFSEKLIIEQIILDEKSSIAKKAKQL